MQVVRTEGNVIKYEFAALIRRCDIAVAGDGVRQHHRCAGQQSADRISYCPPYCADLDLRRGTAWYDQKECHNAH